MNEAFAFFAAALPLALAAGFSDLRTMTIPNWISVALIVFFACLGLAFLPWETVLWRLGAGLLVLILLFFVNSVGIMGGGDAKLLAASTPYVAFADAPQALLILSASMLVTLALHRIARAIPAIRSATPGWKSWEEGKNFPMGISIASALIIYLYLQL